MKVELKFMRGQRVYYVLRAQAGAMSAYDIGSGVIEDVKIDKSGCSYGISGGKAIKEEDIFVTAEGVDNYIKQSIEKHESCAAAASNAFKRVVMSESVKNWVEGKAEISIEPEKASYIKGKGGRFEGSMKKKK
jgi:hypothetical protein